MSGYSESSARSAARFAAETKDHTLTVLQDDGLYRHLRFKTPGTGFYWFDLVTWPGRLAFSGDGDGFTFARDPDMFQFFRDARYGINPQYWAEKITDGRDRAKTYSEEKCRQLVTEYFVDAVRGGSAPAGLGRAVREDILTDDWSELATEDGARAVLNRFEYKGFRFRDTWEWDLREYDWWYLFACHAIQWGISQYDAATKTGGLISV